MLSSLLLLLILALLFSQPRWLLAKIAAIYPGMVYFAKIKEPVVALTIDDGPNAVSTPQILEVLSRYQARVTFFLISNNISGNESLLSNLVQDGHELGNHLTSDQPSIKLSAADFEAQFLEADRVIAQFGQVSWFRPASGWYSPEMLEIVGKYNYRSALGCVFPYDTHFKSVGFAVFQVLFNVRPGSIIVFHDGGDRGERTVLALEKILPQLHRRGYRVVTLSELLALQEG
ncbi:MAG: chitin deacetylase family protein [Coleofasciculaceae cyanobacterium]